MIFFFLNKLIILGPISIITTDEIMNPPPIISFKDKGSPKSNIAKSAPKKDSNVIRSPAMVG